MQFWCWDVNGEDKESGRHCTGHDAYDAAEAYAESLHDYDHSARRFEINVECPDGEVKEVTVDVDWSPDFNARNRRPK